MSRSLILLAVVLSALIATTAGAQRLPPHRFFGQVTVNGAAPAVGASVEAYIGAVRCGSSQTSSEGRYSLDVDHATATSGCGSTGATVSFRIGGATAAQTAQFRDGGFEQLNLSISTVATGFTTAALSLDDPRPCIASEGQLRCDAEREALWNGDAAAWARQGVTDAGERFNETVILRVYAGDPAVIRNIARIINWPFLQVTRVRFIGSAAGQADEYAEISNLGGGEQDMTGWSLRSPSRGLRYAFPNGLVMRPGQVCRVYSGAPGENSCGPTGFNAQDVWPDSESRVVLYFDALDLLGHDTEYRANRNDQPPPPNLQGVN